MSILEEIGLDAYAGNHRTLNKRLIEDNIDLTIFNESSKKHRKTLGKPEEFSNKELFCDNSEARTSVRKRVLRDNLIDYKCSDCGIGPHYNEKSLTLQLDHINGIHTDNRLENLRFLCPNCHSQTETYGTKRFKKKKVYESKEDRDKRLDKIRKFNPNKEELEKLVQELPMTKIGEMFGVSDNAVRKRCKNLGIDLEKLYKYRKPRNKE